MQDVIIFALVGISLISGIVLVFDVKWLRLPHLALPSSLQRPSNLLHKLPFVRRSAAQDGEYEETEFEEYQVYRAVDFGDDDAGSFAASRSPFTVPAPVRRGSGQDGDEEDEGDGFDYRANAFDDNEAADEPDTEEVEDSEGEDPDDEDEDEEEEEKDDIDDMMSFFEKAPEASKIPEALRNEVPKVSSAELLAEAREVAALLRRSNRG